MRKKEKKESDFQGRKQESSRCQADNHLYSLRYQQTLLKAEHSLLPACPLLCMPPPFFLPPLMGQEFKGENGSDQPLGTRSDLQNDPPFPPSLWAHLCFCVDNLEESWVAMVMVVRGGCGTNLWDLNWLVRASTIMNSTWKTHDLKEHLFETFKKGLRPVETQIISLCFYWSSYRRVSWVHVANSLLCKYHVCDYCSHPMQGKFLRKNVSSFSPIYSWTNPSHIWPWSNTPEWRNSEYRV